MSSLSRKTVAWAAGAALAVGGCTAGIVIAAQGGGPAGHGRHRRRAGGRRPAGAAWPRLGQPGLAQPGRRRAGRQRGGDHHRHVQPAGARHRAAAELSPATAGTWRRSGDVAVFTPAKGYPAGTHVTVTVAGLGDSRDRSESSSFKTARYSTLRLQEILAQLGYLPLTWTPAAGAAVPGATPPRSCRRRTRRPRGPSSGSGGTRRSCARSGRRARRTPSTGGPSPASRPTTGCPSTGWRGRPCGRRC